MQPVMIGERERIERERIERETLGRGIAERDGLGSSVAPREELDLAQTIEEFERAYVSPPKAVVAARGLTRTYGKGGAAVHALSDVDIDIAQGRLTAIMGPSGSGKSTLMHILAGLDRPTSGSVRIDGVEITGLKDKQLTQLRRDKIGFIFQSFNLLAMLTADENMVLPLSLARRRANEVWRRTVIEAVGLSDRLTHRPAELSGGQQQRVAVARALISRPAVLFADEPTGNLDSHAGGEVLSLLRRSVDEFGQTVIMVTHDAGAASIADSVVFLKDGRIELSRGRMSRDEIFDTIKGLEGAEPRRNQGEVTR
jgi:putative ABC transport system ATP-binding protein